LGEVDPHIPRPAGESRLDQLVAWAAAATDDEAEAFDGCLVFDEAHRAKNLSADGASAGACG
jgi:hypothetical protein